MIVPGRDDNYPTSSGNVPMNLGAMQQYIPHMSVGLILAIILILIGWHLLFGKKGRRR